MTEPSRPSRWTGLRARLAEWWGRPGARRWARSGLVASALAGVALVAGLALWVNALTVPVQRAGRPTASVAPLPRPTVSTPTSSGSATPGAGEETAAASPPPSADWPKVPASGEFDTAALEVAAAGSSGSLRRFAVQVETSAKLDADKVGRQVAEILNDPRSWAGSGNVRFTLVPKPARAEFTVIIAAPATAKELCAREPSTCLAAGDAVIDASRWRGRAPDYVGRDLWQAYLVNHVVGHLLGEPHQECGKKGRPAPAMMPQESPGLGGCSPNPWPFP